MPGSRRGIAEGRRLRHHHRSMNKCLRVGLRVSRGNFQPTRLFKFSFRFGFKQHGFENFLEPAAPPKNPGLHRADATLQNFRHFFVAEALDVAQNHRAAKRLRNLLQRALHGLLNFVRGELLEGCAASIRNLEARLPFLRLRIDRNIFLQVALEPALLVQRFADGDAIEPGLQGTALAELTDAAKGLQKNFLCAVGGVRGITEHAEDQVINRRMIMSGQPVEGRLRARLELVDKFRFAAAPTEGTSPIGHCRPFRPECISHSCRMRKPGSPYETHRSCSAALPRSEEHTSELQSLTNLVCRVLLEKKKISYEI